MSGQASYQLQIKNEGSIAQLQSLGLNIVKEGFESKILLNDQELENIDLIKIGDGILHLVIQDQSIEIEFVEYNEDAKSYLYKVNGKKISLSAKSKLQLQIEKMGLGAGSSSKANDLKAPMPGLIVGIHVDVGQKVVKGDTLLVLEAMKMENSIKATGEGVVKKVSVSTGDKVDKGQVLVQFA
jgi:biotin carboxyl carrier protein